MEYLPKCRLAEKQCRSPLRAAGSGGDDKSVSLSGVMSYRDRKGFGPGPRSGIRCACGLVCRTAGPSATLPLISCQGCAIGEVHATLFAESRIRGRYRRQRRKSGSAPVGMTRCWLAEGVGFRGRLGNCKSLHCGRDDKGEVGYLPERAAAGNRCKSHFRLCSVENIPQSNRSSSLSRFRTGSPLRSDLKALRIASWWGSAPPLRDSTLFPMTDPALPCRARAVPSLRDWFLFFAAESCGGRAVGRLVRDLQLRADRRNS